MVACTRRSVARAEGIVRITELLTSFAGLIAPFHLAEVDYARSMLLFGQSDPFGEFFPHSMPGHERRSCPR